MDSENLYKLVKAKAILNIIVLLLGNIFYNFW